MPVIPSTMNAPVFASAMSLRFCLTRKKNDWLYSMDGLTTAYEALRPRGILAVWSARADRKFKERLRKVGFKVSQHRVRAHNNEGELHMIWLAERGP